MGKFIEPDVVETLNEKPKVFTDEFISSVVKKSIDSGEIPKDHKLIFIAATDEQGIKAIIGVSHISENNNLSINFIAEHDWDGDNRAGAKVIFSHK